MIKFRVVVVVAGLAGCGSEKVDQCDKDSDCTNIVYPFCDVAGQYAPSGGETHVCTIKPADCPVDRCGCSPGATTCTGNQITTCNTDGMSVSTDTCTLGCSDAKDHCLRFDPTNGLGPALTLAADESAIVLPTGASLNTDTGEVTDSAHVSIAVNSLVVSQPGAPDIRVFLGKSFDISNVVVSGTKVVAFVAPGVIAVRGSLDISANATNAGPGGLDSGACVGGLDEIGGGAGNATVGGNGVAQDHLGVGGVTEQGLTPLLGGCRGGGGPTLGGGGGGGLQMDSLTSIEILSVGLIDAGAGGGSSTYGGGSGGNIVFEAPMVAVEGTVTANGGGGGACGNAGEDGKPSVHAALGTGCNTGPATYGGDGGTETTPAKDAFAVGGVVHAPHGGGGGSVGRMRVATVDGTYSIGTSSVTSVVIATDTLTLK